MCWMVWQAQASLTIFGSSEEATPRLQAFLAIRALSLVMPPPFMEKCLRVSDLVCSQPCRAPALHGEVSAGE